MLFAKLEKCKFQFIALFEMRTAPLAPRACEGGGRVKRGRGEYIRTPPVTAYGGASPLINAGAEGGVAANCTINCNLIISYYAVFTY